jgi:hypothetical protein
MIENFIGITTTLNIYRSMGLKQPPIARTEQTEQLRVGQSRKPDSELVAETTDGQAYSLPTVSRPHVAASLTLS